MEEEIIETIEEETFDYSKLRYILKDGYVCHASLGASIVCDLGECTEYNGDVPSGYETIEEWFDEENDKLNAWKVVNGNLIFDEQKCEELQAKCKLEEELNSCASKKYVNEKLNKSTTIFDDNMCSISNDLHILNSNESEIPEIIIEGTGDIKTNSDGYIEDARSVPLKSDFIYGMSIQEIPTTGKNICPTDFDIEWESGHYGMDGVPGVMDSRVRVKRLIDVLPNTTYYVNTFSNDKYPFVIREYYSDGTFYRSIGGLTDGATFTTAINGAKIGIAIYDNTGGATFDKYKTFFENGTITPFICLNSETDKTFEEYIPNGISPDYPSKIINNRGIENLFNLEEYPFANKIAYSGGEQVWWTGYCGILNYFPVEENETYTFSNDLGKNIAYGLVYYDENKNILSTGANNIRTFTTPTNCKYIRLAIQSDVLPTWVQIVKGSITHTPVPYGSNYLVQTICGRNLLPFIKKNSETINGVTFTQVYNSDGSLAYVNISGTATATTTYRYYGIDTVTPQKIFDKPVKIGFGQTGSSTTFCMVVWGLNSSGGNIGKVIYRETNYEAGFQLAGIGLRVFSGVTINTKVYPMISLDGGEYEPYKETLTTYDLQGNELCDINGVRDGIDLVSGVLTKRIGKVILNGSENWLSASSIASGTSRFYFNFNNIINSGIVGDKNVYVISDKFVGTSFKAIYTDDGKSQNLISNYTDPNSISSRRLHIRISNNIASDVATFKTWLSNNPVEVYYVLAEPETIQLEPTEIITYEGINNIYTESNVDVEEVDITYATQKTSLVDGLKVHISNDNILPIETINQSLNELDMAINEDKSISLYGTPTNDTEFILNGSMDNIDPIFMLSKYNDFIVSGLTNDVSLNLYSNDGTNRELVYSGSNGDLRFDDNKIITCATLSVASGKELDIEIQPMITLDYIDYVEGKRNDLIDIPINELNRNEYLKIDREYIKLCDGEDENELKVVGTIKSFNPNTLIQLNDDKVKLTTKYFGDGYINERLAKVEVEQEKINFEVSKKVGEDEVVNAINLSTEEIKIKGNRLVVDADNFQLDKNGTLVCQNATIRGSELILNDDGSFENASIKIKTTKKINKDVAILTDLNGSCLTQIFGDKFNFREASSQVIFTTDKNYKVELVKTTLGSASHTYGYQHQVIVSGTNFNEVIYDVTYNQDEGTYKTNVNVQELQLPDEFGVVKTINSSTYLPYIKKLLINAGLTTYSSEGMEADIYSNYKYTRDDYIKVQEYLIGTRTLSAEELLFYDANGDGKVNLQDMIIIGNNGGQYNVSDTENGKFIIDTTGINENLQILDKDNNKVVSMGITGTKVLTLNHPVFPDSHNQIEVGEALTYRKGDLESVCGTWIDGKLIYRKVFQVENITATTIPNWSAMIDLDIDVDTMVKLDGCYEVTGNAWTPINMPLSSSQTISTHYNSDTKQLHIMSTFDISKGHIILEYTKNE